MNVIQRSVKDIKCECSTLTRHLREYVASEGTDFEYSVNYAVKKVFTEQDEERLVKIYPKCSII